MEETDSGKQSSLLRYTNIDGLRTFYELSLGGFVVKKPVLNDLLKTDIVVGII
jgi:hypothetical protein